MTGCCYNMARDIAWILGGKKQDDTFVAPAECLDYIEGSEWRTGMVLHRI